ncbi:MAG TPA: helix-turn-helix domain-containing protein [Actinomycetota bacterium]|nr:helix-turn-helix domain-containing protein [Actinomycetota bacterium]
MSERHLGPASAALREALGGLGDRWSLLVVEALLAEPRRFSDLARDLGGIAPNVLSERLKRLEREGVVSATPYSSRPLRLAYDLTPEGRELAGAIRLLADWGARRSGQAPSLRHRTCGTALEARWYCPTCSRAVEEPETDDLRFV